MSIWVEYFKYEDPRWENTAQMRESSKWVEPKNVQKRFFDNKADAVKFQSGLSDRGWHCIIKQDRGAGS